MKKKKRSENKENMHGVKGEEKKKGERKERPVHWRQKKRGGGRRKTGEGGDSYI